MSPGRMWWILQRDLRRGPRAAWGYYLVRPRIWRWRNPYAGQPVGPVSIHLLCGAEHADLAAWMMASWLTATGRNWNFVVHDDGTLPAATTEHLVALGLTLRRIGRADADAALGQALANHPLCATYRRRHPLALKIFDAPHYAGAPRFILLDTDILFFAPPREILEWVDRPDDASCHFNADAQEASTVTPAEARQKLGFELWPKVNSGLCLLVREALNLDLCERIFATTAVESGHSWRIEQTLFALCASHWGNGGLLPSSYEVSLGTNAAPGCIARHYVGAVRDRFYAEGMFRLKEKLRL